VAPVTGLRLHVLQERIAAGPDRNRVPARIEQPRQGVAEVGIVVDDMDLRGQVLPLHGGLRGVMGSRRTAGRTPWQGCSDWS
jgi:hypothetical protein